MHIKQYSLVVNGTTEHNAIVFGNTMTVFVA